MDKFTAGILALLVGGAAVLMVCILRMDPPKATTPLGPEPKPVEVFPAALKAELLQLAGWGLLYAFEFAAIAFCAVEIIAAGVRLGLQR
jgi:hypothetical protein